jgi:hypothetical protein
VAPGARGRRLTASVARSAIETVRLANPGSTLSLRPALEAVVDGGRKGKMDFELAYLTGGLSWNAEHTVVRRGENEATWSTAVTVENSTGRDYVDATLKLVAGEPRRVGPSPQPMMARAEKMMVMADAGALIHLDALYNHGIRHLLGTRRLHDREPEPHDGRAARGEARAALLLPRRRPARRDDAAHECQRRGERPRRAARGRARAYLRA